MLKTDTPCEPVFDREYSSARLSSSPSLLHHSPPLSNNPHIPISAFIDRFLVGWHLLTVLLGVVSVVSFTDSTL